MDFYSLIILAILKKIFYRKLTLFFMITVNYKEILKERSFFMRKIIYFLISWAVKMINCFIFVSRELELETIRFFNISKKNTNRTIIYHGIALNKKKLAVKCFPKKNPIVLYVGRLEKQKDIETIIKSFSLLIKKIKTARLWIVGDGTEKQRLKTLVRDLNLNSKTRFFGWQKNVINFFQKARVFVLASHFEGFSYVIIEAMSQGLPIIATKTPFGPSEILQEGKFGIMIPMHNPHKMAMSLEKILTDKKLYTLYSKLSLKRVKFFSEKKMLNKLKKLFMLYDLS